MSVEIIVEHVRTGERVREILIDGAAASIVEQLKAYGYDKDWKWKRA